MRTINVVSPVYKNLEQIKNLYTAIKNQKEVNITKIVFSLTLSSKEVDQEIISFMEEKGISYFTVTQEEFSHSLTREKAIREYCDSEIVVLCSQDIKITDEYALKKLTDALNDEVVYVYGRQTCNNHSIEKYIRKKNYPKEGYVVSKADIDKLQIMAFFSSDAFSALDRNVFIKLNGYQGFNVMMGEDMLYSKFILDNGYKKAYVAEAIVEHSHKYTLKQLYNRYYETGKFHKEVGFFKNYKTNDSGLKLALSVLGQALIHFDIIVIFRWLPDMAARYLGMRKGKK